MHIHHYSVGRSGCTLVSQLLAGVFGREHLSAGHAPYFLDGDQPLVITLRDFRDVALSFWRVHNDISKADLRRGRQATRQELQAQLVPVKRAIREALLPCYERNERVLLLRYEDFFPGRYDVIFDQFEEFFNVSIGAVRRKKLQKAYSFQRNKYKASKLSSFREYDSDYIHGGHCHKGEIGGWRALLPRSLHSELELTLAAELRQWGYTVHDTAVGGAPAATGAPIWRPALGAA